MNWWKLVAGVSVPVVAGLVSFDARYLLLTILKTGGQILELRAKSPAELREAARVIFGGKPAVYTVGCGTNDIDFNMHLSNSKYFVHGDFSRMALGMKAGLFSAAHRAGLSFVVASVSMRFRKEIPLGKIFSIESRIVGWDEVSVFIEQRFLSKSAKSGNVDLNGLMLCRLQLTKKGKMATVFKQMGLNDLPERKLPPPDVIAWALSVVDANARVKAEAGDEDKSGTSVKSVSDDGKAGIKPSSRLKSKI
jgi:acyl-CoA thioesterase FadM